MAPDMHVIPRAPRCRNKRREEFQPLSGFLLSLGLEVAPVSASQSWATSLHLCSFMGDLGLIRIPVWTPPSVPTWSVPHSPALPGDPIVHAKSLQSCPTLCDPTDCSPPGSSVHGILQARILEWVAMPSSRGSSRPRDRTPVSCTGRQVLHH